MLDRRAIEAYNHPRQMALLMLHKGYQGVQMLASRCSSGVEHRFRKASVVGSNPTSGFFVVFCSRSQNYQERRWCIDAIPMDHCFTMRNLQECVASQRKMHGL